MEKRIRKHIIFYGRVQGVAFRYRAYYEAKQLGIGGFVRNLDDGTVEMEAEGTDDQIESLIDFLKRQDLIRIDHMKVNELAPEGGRMKFSIWHG